MRCPSPQSDQPTEPSLLSRRLFLHHCATWAAAAGIPLPRSSGAGVPDEAEPLRAATNRSPAEFTPPERHWPKWKSLSAYFYDGPILGNGLIGAVAHRATAERFPQHAGALLLAFNRADLTQPVDPRVPEGADAARFMVGRFALRTSAATVRIELELDLSRAELRGVVHTAKGDLSLRVFVHATRPLLVVDQRASGGAEPAQIEFLPAPAGVVVDLGRVDYEETATYRRHPPARRSEKDGVNLHEQSVGGGISFTVGWTQWATAPGASRFVATLEASDPVKAPRFHADEVLRHARFADFTALEREHRRWWSEHYQPVYLSLPNDPAVERFWWLQQYKIGCLLRPDLQVLDLNGPWYCHTPWPAIWWNLNTQMMYRHLAAGNRSGLASPLLELLERNAHQLQANLPPAWRGNGALAIGRASSFDLDSPVTMVANEADPTREGREAGNLLWVLHTLWWIARHHPASGAWDERLLPLLRGAVRLYDGLLEPGADGTWHLKETFSPEYKAAPDCHFDLALLRWAGRTLASLAPQDAEAVRWRDVANHLAPYPVSPDGTFAVGRGVPFDRGHRHFSHLLAIWPVADFDVSDTAGAELARRSIEHWKKQGELAGWSYAVMAHMHARLGDGTRARSELDSFLQSLTFPTLYREAGLCLETPFIGLDAIHSMLVQSGPDWVRVLPAVPASWLALELRGLRVFGAATIDITSTRDEVVAVLRTDSAFRARVAGPPGCVLIAPTPRPELLTLQPHEMAELRWRRHSPSDPPGQS